MIASVQAVDGPHGAPRVAALVGGNLNHSASDSASMTLTPSSSEELAAAPDVLAPDEAPLPAPSPDWLYAPKDRDADGAV